MTGLLAFLVRVGFGRIVSDALAAIERRADAEGDREKVRLQATVAVAQQVVEETRIMADFNRAKLEHRAFWWALCLTVGILDLWMLAVVIDCIPYLRDIFGDQQVHDLPTPALRDAFAAMIKWQFFVGSGVAGARFLIR